MMLYLPGPIIRPDAREARGMRRMALGLMALAVCVMMVAPVGMMVESGKPAPPPPQEPTGMIDLHSAHDQLVLLHDISSYPNSIYYIRLYDWDTSVTPAQYKHIWSAPGSACLLGDVDNDGSKELIGGKWILQGTGNNQVQKAYLQIWENYDMSDSPSYSQLLIDRARTPMRMELGDVDGDGLKELITQTQDKNSISCIEVWDFSHKDANGNIVKDTPTGPTNVIYDHGSDVGSGGLDVGDSDNDGIDEILVGYSRGSNPTNKAAIIDHSDTGYNVVAYIGAPVVDCIAVANLGTIGNIVITSTFVWTFVSHSNILTPQQGSNMEILPTWA